MEPANAPEQPGSSKAREAVPLVTVMSSQECGPSDSCVLASSFGGKNQTLQMLIRGGEMWEQKNGLRLHNHTWKQDRLILNNNL